MNTTNSTQMGDGQNVKLNKEYRKKLATALHTMQKLEEKEKNHLIHFDSIRNTSPFCQLHQKAFDELDKAIEYNKKRVIIWNEIRNFIINHNGETLWQKAIRLNYAVRRIGNETILQSSTDDIRKLIEVEG